MSGTKSASWQKHNLISCQRSHHILSTNQWSCSDEKKRSPHIILLLFHSHEHPSRFPPSDADKARPCYSLNSIFLQTPDVSWSWLELFCWSKGRVERQDLQNKRQLFWLITQLISCGTSKLSDLPFHSVQMMIFLTRLAAANSEQKMMAFCTSARLCWCSCCIFHKFHEGLRKVLQDVYVLHMCYISKKLASEPLNALCILEYQTFFD